MHIVYILQSAKDHGFYIGFTTRTAHERLIEHQNGLVDSTKNRRPVSLVYYEAYVNEQMARKRESDVKRFASSYQGLMKRLGYK